MTDKDISKLASKLSGNLATKEGVKRLEEKIDTILEFSEGTEEEVQNHEKRIKAIKRVPVVAHELKSTQ